MWSPCGDRLAEASYTAQSSRAAPLMLARTRRASVAAHLLAIETKRFLKISNSIG